MFSYGARCTVLYCTMWVTMAAEAGMTIQVGPLRKAPSVCKVCIFVGGVWQLLVTARVSLLGEPGAVCL